MNKEEAIKKNLEGLELYRDGKYEEALILFNEAIENDPENASAWLNRSEANSKLGRQADADADREKWKLLMPVYTEETQQGVNKSYFRGIVDAIGEDHEYKIRGRLCTQLRSLGIDAQLSDPLRSIENIECGFNSESLGLISITESPIRWAYIIRQRGRFADDEIIYYIKYVVPDSKLSKKSRRVNIEPELKGDKWQWRGKDSGLGIIDRLNNDKLTNYWLDYMESQMLTIRNYPKRSLWIISSRVPKNMPTTISEDSWNCYQAIANHLLAQ